MDDRLMDEWIDHWWMHEWMFDTNTWIDKYKNEWPDWIEAIREWASE